MHVKSDPVLEELVSKAFRRFDESLKAALPLSAPRLREFLHRVPTGPEHIFNIRAFPIVTLPYWLSPNREREVDREFQSDLIYSSISGYYAIRLCDNIADNDCPPELRKLAPCTLYFDNEAFRPYMNHFPITHEFWNAFNEFLASQAESSAADSLLDDVDEDSFARVSSKKFTGTKIPLSAVRFRYASSLNSFEQWSRFVDVLGNFAQFNNDFFDWRHDSIHGIITYVSSESRRRAPEESVESWFMREGFDWGNAELKLRFNNVKVLADALGNEDIQSWLTLRGQTLDSDIEKVRSVLEITKTLIKVTSSPQT